MALPPRKTTDRVTKGAFLLSVGLHLLFILILVLFVRDISPLRIVEERAVQPAVAFVEINEVFPRRTEPTPLPEAVPVPVPPPTERRAEDAPLIEERFPTPVVRPPVSRPPEEQLEFPAGGGGPSGGATGPQGDGGLAPGSGAPGGAGGDGNALRPGYRDSRFYALPSPYELDTRTDHEKYMEHFTARIDAVNDSMGIARARNRTTSDWTYTDAEGRRWGLSPEGLHLGNVTVPRALLPLPGASGDNASIEAGKEQERQRQEIIRQEATREREETREERIRAMEDARNGGSGGGDAGGN
jgi:hypothetical protein